MWTVVGISGVTCGGKSVGASSVQKTLESLGLQVKMLQVDDFFLPEDRLQHLPHLSNWNWDEPDALDFDRLLSAVQEEMDLGTRLPSVLIVEGISMFANRELADLCALKYFITLDYLESKSIAHK